MAVTSETIALQPNYTNAETLRMAKVCRMNILAANQSGSVAGRAWARAALVEVDRLIAELEGASASAASSTGTMTARAIFDKQQ